MRAGCHLDPDRKIFMSSAVDTFAPIGRQVAQTADAESLHRARAGLPDSPAPTARSGRR